MGDIKKSVSTFKALLSDDGQQAHFLYLPGPPPHIEFGRSKFGTTEAGAVIGMATRLGNSIYLTPKAAKDLKEPMIRDLNKVVKTKLGGVLFQLGDGSDNEAAQKTDDNDDDTSDGRSDGKARASSDAGDAKVAAVMQTIQKSAGNLLTRSDLPPQLAAVQAALNKAAKTSTGDPKSLVAAFQKLRTSAMTFDAEREATQNASTSEYGNIPKGPQDNDHPPLPPTPENAEGDYGNIPKGPEPLPPTPDDPGPLPPTPDDPDANYGDLPVVEGKSDTGYDDTYQDLDLVLNPGDDNAAPAAGDDNAEQEGPYGAVTQEQLEAYAQEKAQQIREIEDMFNDQIKTTVAKLEKRLDGTDYAPGTKKNGNLHRGMDRFIEIAEGPDPDYRHLVHILQELRKEVVAMVKAIKAKSAT